MNVIKDKLDKVDWLALKMLQDLSIAAHAAKGPLLTGRISEWRHFDVNRDEIYAVHSMDGVSPEDYPKALAELDEEVAKWTDKQS